MAAPSPATAATVEAREVRAGVYVMHASGGNVTALVTDDGLAVVDPRALSSAEAVLATLASLSDEPVRYVFNTHAHRDHTAANGRMGGTVIAHRNVATRLKADQVFQGRKTPAAPRLEWPDETYTEARAFELGRERIELRHLHGAHTDGDTIVWFREADVLVLGDVFFPGKFPYVDPDMDGDVLALARHIEALRVEIGPHTRLISGHFGPVTGKDALDAYAEMIATSIDMVERGVAEGLDDQALVARGLPERYSTWSWGVCPQSLWIELVARSIRRKNADASASTDKL